MRKSGIAVWVLVTLALAVLLAFTGTRTAVILLVAAVVLPPAQMLLAVLAAPRVTVEIAMPATVKKGLSAQGKVVIRNRSLIPVARVSTEVGVLNLLTRERRVFAFGCSLMPRGSAELPFVFGSETCGQLVFDRSGARVGDMLGLYSPKTRETEPPPFRRIVVPELFTADVRLASRDTPAGDDATRYLGKKGWDRSEVFQLRDFAEGDSQKQIHWKLTAKHGRFIVADPSEPIEHSLLVFWDGAGIPDGAPPSVADALAEALVTVCAALAENGIPYSLAWGSGTPGRPAVREITVINDLYDAVPEILSVARTDGGAFDGLEGWRRVAYFSGRVIPEADELAGRVSAFICAADAEELPEADGSAVVFSPADYRSALADVIV